MWHQSMGKLERLGKRQPATRREMGQGTNYFMTEDETVAGSSSLNQSWSSYPGG
jgi:hypothetical protein